MPEWEQVTGLAPIWKPTKAGEKIEGKIVKKTKGNYGDMAVIDQGKDGLIATPSNVVLKSRMPDLEVGDIVRITFVGSGGKGKRKYKNFKIERKKA
jgi:hypothetical protein